MNPGFPCTGRMTDSVYGVVWVSGLLMSTLWIELPMVAVGLWYGQAYFMDNEHRSILLMAFWMNRDTVTRSWGPLLCHSSTTITSCCSMLQGSVHNSWKLKTSQFLHGQHTHRTCHPLGMFGMLWIGVYDSVFQFLPISSNFTQPLKRSGPTFHRPQSTTWSTLCEGDVLHCVRQMVVTPDTDWFSDTCHTCEVDAEPILPYAEYASCVRPAKNQGAPLLPNILLTDLHEALFYLFYLSMFYGQLCEQHFCENFGTCDILFYVLNFGMTM